MRVCLYLRISTDEDHQPTSLGTQRERLERYCEAMEDWHRRRLRGPGERHHARPPGLTQALGLAREQRFDLLLVYRVDRLAARCVSSPDWRGARPARHRPEVGDRAVRHRLAGGADDAADARRVRRVRARHDRRPRHRRARTPRPRRPLDERPHPYGYTRAKGQAARARPGEGAGRAAHLPALRRGQARHHRDRAHARGRRRAGAAQAGLVAERAAADPRQPRLPRPRPLERRDPSRPARAARRRGDVPKAQEILRRRGEDASLRRGNPSDFLLSGLVRCDHCGRAYVGTSAHGRSGRYTYYACSTRYKYGPAKCTGERLPEDRLELPSSLSSPSSTATVASSSEHSPSSAKRPKRAARVRGAARSTRSRDRPRRTQARALLRSLRSRRALSRPLPRTRPWPPWPPRGAARPRSRPHRPPRHTGAHSAGRRRPRQLADELEEILAAKSPSKRGTFPSPRQRHPSAPTTPPDHPPLTGLPTAVRAIPGEVGPNRVLREPRRHRDGIGSGTSVKRPPSRERAPRPFRRAGPPRSIT